MIHEEEIVSSWQVCCDFCGKGFDKKSELTEHLGKIMETMMYQCPKGCHRYRQSIEEIVEAGNKHKDKLLALKRIAEDQKVKISSLREERNALLDNVDHLEFKQKDDNEMILRLTREMRDLKVQIRDHRMDVIEKEEVVRAQSDNILSVNALKTKVNDLEDEIIEKDEEILNLKQVAEKHSSIQEVSSLSLEHELKNSLTNMKEKNIEQENEALEKKTKSLEEELKTIKENAAIGAEERNKLYTKLNELTESKRNDLEKLKKSVQNLRERQKCWYGMNCRRLFCNFDHNYLFKKDNRVQIATVDSAKISGNDVVDILCDECGQILKKEDYKKHIDNEHKEQLKNFKCTDCSFIFGNMSDLSKHTSRQHTKSDVECEKCGIFFINQDELKEHEKEIHVKCSEERMDIVALTRLLEDLVDETPGREESTEDMKSFKCDECKNKYQTERSLIVHTKRKHQTSKGHPSIPEFTCGLCAISFESVDQMDKHMDDNHGGRWKIYDDDVILEGEDYVESSSDSSETETETENSESQSGED